MPLDTPTVCHSMLLDLGLRLLLHPAWGDPFKGAPTPAVAQFLQTPDVLGVVLLLLTLQTAAVAQDASTASSSQHAPDSTRSALPAAAAVTQQQVQELQQQLESLWQQLGIRPELLPSFLAAMQPKYELQYVGSSVGFAEPVGLTGPAEAFSLITSNLTHLLVLGAALKTLGAS
jgi:hypothetical protein